MSQDEFGAAEFMEIRAIGVAKPVLADVEPPCIRHGPYGPGRGFIGIGLVLAAIGAWFLAEALHYPHLDLDRGAQTTIAASQSEAIWTGLEPGRYMIFLVHQPGESSPAKTLVPEVGARGHEDWVEAAKRDWPFPVGPESGGEAVDGKLQVGVGASPVGRTAVAVSATDPPVKVRSGDVAQAAVVMAIGLGLAAFAGRRRLLWRADVRRYVAAIEAQSGSG